MDPLFTVILAVLAALAITGLVVGVSNDASNFLNSAIGSKSGSAIHNNGRGIGGYNSRIAVLERHDGGGP